VRQSYARRDPSFGNRAHPRSSGLLRPGNSITLLKLSAVSSPQPATGFTDGSPNSNEGRCVTRKNTLASFVVAVVLSLSLTACKDTKTLQENEQLKAQVADLQKQVGQLGNNLETVTADRDELMKENTALKAKAKAKPAKAKHAAKKKKSRKHRQA
jgi:hypothetical protein